MSLEIRELVVKVTVGSTDPATPRGLNEVELAELKRELVETCLAALRRRLAERDER